MSRSHHRIQSSAGLAAGPRRARALLAATLALALLAVALLVAPPSAQAAPQDAPQATAPQADPQVAPQADSQAAAPVVSQADPQTAPQADPQAAPEAAAQATAPVGTQATTHTARPSTSGQLHVSGTYLVDAQGGHAVLRGVSTHGLQWFPEYVNEPLFAQLSDEWDCNLVRLAFYSKDYCEASRDVRERLLRLLRTGIDACIAHDMYVLVDWHILDDNDPNQNIDEAKAFFELISSEYANVPNLLYEICNEPNGDTSWSDVSAYAEEVIPVIRAQSPQAVVMVGTPDYDRDLMSALRHPLPFDDVMYALHFYVASHYQDLRDELLAALDGGLPVFITECGLSEASGDGAVDFESAVTWFDILAEHDVGYAIWSLSNKAETSAFARLGTEDPTHLKEEDLTPIGRWCRALIQGTDPSDIPVPEPDGEGFLKAARSKLLATLNGRDLRSIRSWTTFALGALAALAVYVVWKLLYRRRVRGRLRSYDDLVAATSEGDAAGARRPGPRAALVAIFASTLFTLIYLCWRFAFSIPTSYGWLAVTCNVLLLIVEVFGFAESLVHYRSMVNMSDHPLPTIDDGDYPDVDIFIATYNEPCDLLRRTINGCKHLRYPDRSKVHVWVCDDNRRPEMRALAEEMGVGYFDRPDNQGAKAGNLNHALGLTSAPYVVTLDADMIVRSDFLLKTIPYFVDAEQRAARLLEEQQVHLGLLQTPQAFYDPDVFQHALYAESRATNEQDFFYRTIEVAKASDNSVIYGGSNTVLSRAALEAIGGFYTESITEDFATGMLIESAGFVSLAIPEPLASGRTPHSFKEHIKQRTRWGRGVIVTARKLHLFRRPGLTLAQRISYWSSVAYWYSPLKNVIYIVSPLLFAVFSLPVFECSWLDLLAFWLPMYAAQTICLRVVSGSAVSSKWSGIHETSVMAHLLIPIVKEMLGISLTSFKVTDKSGEEGPRTTDWRSMAPYLVLLALSAIGIVRVTWLMGSTNAFGLVVLLFWLLRNAYYLLMAVFLIDGRDSDGEVVRVLGAEPLTVTKLAPDGTPLATYKGVATVLTEHNMRVFLDDAEGLGLGDRVGASVDTPRYHVELGAAVVGLTRSRYGKGTVHVIEILDFGGAELEYLQVLYDRIPSLPQALKSDYNMLSHLWRNVAHRVARTVE